MSTETTNRPVMPYIKNCIIIPRDKGSIMFYDEGRLIHPYLDGYAIIPVENYNKMKAKLAEYESNDKYSLKA